MNRLLTTLLAAAAFPSASWAGLEWKDRALQFKPTPFDKEVVAHFDFKNTGLRPVTVKDVRIACSCMRVEMDKTTFAAGERGTLTAIFTIGHRMGSERRPITVETDDPEQPKTALYLLAEIPSVMTLKPAFLFWREGEELSPKSVLVETGAEFPVERIEALSKDGRLDVKVEPLPEGKSYRVTVQPKADRMTATILQIDAILPGAQRKSANAYVRVR